MGVPGLEAPGQLELACPGCDIVLITLDTVRADELLGLVERTLDGDVGAIRETFAEAMRVLERHFIAER